MASRMTELGWDELRIGLGIESALVRGNSGMAMA
jgi:hypothetical protein